MNKRPAKQIQKWINTHFGSLVHAVVATDDPEYQELIVAAPTVFSAEAAVEQALAALIPQDAPYRWYQGESRSWKRGGSGIRYQVKLKLSTNR